MLPVCNITLDNSTIVENPLWSADGHQITWHHLGLFIAAAFGLVSILVAGFLIFAHATHYLRPWEQRHIIRILLMIPIYSTVSFLSYLFYQHATYFEVLRDCYEAFAIASFFTLLCHYIAPNLHDQKEYFRTIKPYNWFWSVFGLQRCTGGENKGPFRKPRSGLTWFNIIWVGVFQYCFIQVFFTVVAAVTEAFGRYCQSSLSPAFSHIWVTAFEAAGVTVAMFMIIQFYLQLRQDLADHKPFLKVLCIKLVIFFSFWQNIIISLLTSSRGPLKPTPRISYNDFKVGIPSVMLCVEMAIFSVLHIFAFPWKEYSIKHSYSDPLTAPGSGYSGGQAKYKGGPLGLYALADAFNPWDIIKASARGFRWLFVGVRHREDDISYQDPNKLYVAGNSYAGPRYPGTGDPATELRPSDDLAAGARRRGDTLATDVGEDDRAGLLRHSQNMAGHGGVPASISSPYRTPTNDEYASGDDSQLDSGASHKLQPVATSSSGGFADTRPPDFEQQDTGYHPGVGPSRVHPALRGQGVQGHDWDHWGGARSHGPMDVESIAGRPPPGYRSNDPRGF